MFMMFARCCDCLEMDEMLFSTAFLVCMHDREELYCFRPVEQPSPKRN